MKRKLVIMLVVLCVGVTMVGCGEKAEEPTTQDTALEQEASGVDETPVETEASTEEVTEDTAEAPTETAAEAFTEEITETTTEDAAVETENLDELIENLGVHDFILDGKVYDVNGGTTVQMFLNDGWDYYPINEIDNPAEATASMDEDAIIYLEKDDNVIGVTAINPTDDPQNIIHVSEGIVKIVNMSTYFGTSFDKFITYGGMKIGDDKQKMIDAFEEEGEIVGDSDFTGLIYQYPEFGLVYIDKEANTIKELNLDAYYN